MAYSRRHEGALLKLEEGEGEWGVLTLACLSSSSGALGGGEWQ